MSRFLLPLLMVFCSTVFSQYHTITPVFKNDMYYGTDFYFTNAIELHYQTNLLKFERLDPLFFGIDEEVEQVMGVSIIQSIYTPKNIRESEILADDRPYAGTFIIRNSYAKYDHRQQFAVEHNFALGVVGPISLAGQLQKAWHETIKGIRPKGWDNQVRNDLLISYRLSVVKGLLNYKNRVRMGVNSSAELGTLFNRATFGLYFEFGKMADLFKPFDFIKSWQFYFTSGATANLTFYDATIMGGVFNSNNPHTLKYTKLQHLNYRSFLGGTFSFKNIKISYKQHFLFREFSGSLPHGWGEVSGTIGF